MDGQLLPKLVADAYGPDGQHVAHVDLALTPLILPAEGAQPEWWAHLQLVVERWLESEARPGTYSQARVTWQIASTVIA